MGVLAWFGKGKSEDEFPAADVFEDHVSTPAVPVKPEPPKDAAESEQHAPSDVTFDDIVHQFDVYRTQALTSQDQIKASLSKLQQTQAENANLTTLVQQLRYQNQTLQGTVKGQGREISNIQHINKQLKAMPKPHSGQAPGLNGSGHKLYANLLAEHEKLQAYTLFINEKAQDMQLELELLKCTAMPGHGRISIEHNNPDLMQLTPQPYVVVLVDGDAYAWNIDVFKSPTVRSRGALAAIRLKNEVMQHIAESKDIPVSSRVVAKVYINGSSRQSNSQRRQSFRAAPPDLLAAFRMQFTEAIPLFDFVDVGHGKERADEKIRENFHLHLTNPHCHRVFLAACTDNGFARMLEQYQYHTAAYEKIVLVSRGYVESEIARLGFRAVVWPSVFARKEAANQTIAQQKQKAVEEQARREMESHHRKLGLRGVKNERAAEIVKQTMKSGWDGKLMLGGQAGIMALRMMAARQDPGIRSSPGNTFEQLQNEEELD